MNELITEIKKSKMAVKLKNTLIGNLLHVDDIILIADKKELQKMLDIVSEHYNK